MRNDRKGKMRKKASEDNYRKGIELMRKENKIEGKIG